MDPVGEKGSVSLGLGLRIDIGGIIKIMRGIRVIPQMNVEKNTPFRIGLHFHHGCR
jgi:hypothetical protein